jgi:hypothetical protein
MNKVLKEALKRLFNPHLRTFIAAYIEDILILSGLIIIIKTTFLLSIIAGLYTLGGILLLLGLYFARNPTERR